MRVRYLLTAIALALATGSAYSFDPPAALPVGPPAAPAIKSAVKPACPVCADECKCKPGECPGKCPVADPKRSVVRIDLGNHGGSGTVFWSEGGISLCLTNSHVGKCDGRVTVTHESKTYEGFRGAYCDVEDLAIIWVKAALPAAELAENDPSIGARVRFWGRTTPFSEGKVVGETVLSEGRSLTGSYNSASGDSGSGMFDDDGKLVGIHWGKIWPDDPRKVEAFVPVSAATVFVYEKCEHFPTLRERLKSRIAAHQIARGMKKLTSPFDPPPAKPIASASPTNPFGSSCPNGVCPASGSCPGGNCPNQSYGRRGLIFRR